MQTKYHELICNRYSALNSLTFFCQVTFNFLFSFLVFQVRLEDTEWSYPVKITKEDTFFLVLRRSNGTRKILRTEVRGFEEGSRFIVVFRCGSTDGPIRYLYFTSINTSTYFTLHSD